MQNGREEKIQLILKEEVARRGPGSAFAFASISVLTFIYHYHTVHSAVFVKLASVIMFLAAVLRYACSKNYLREPEKNSWRGIEIACWMNCLAWGVIYSLVAYELRNKGLHFAILVAVMTGALSGSLVTLANRPNLYLPFLFVSIAPLSAISLLQYFSWNQNAGLIYVLVYVTYAAYQLIQYRSIKHIQYDRVKKQIDLEASLEELKASQDAFVKQTAKLFHASKLSALGEMAGGLSHEVNNSLMTIMGSVQQLDRYFQRDKINNPDYQKKIQNSHQAIAQIKTVIDGLRFFSQQADEGEKIDRPLEEIIQRTLNFCNEMIKANEITMIVAPVPPVMVHCNPMQITQILFYLTKNAFDALEGVNDPMKRWIRISFIERDQDVEIRVMNGGPQISSDVKNRLFQPFFTTKEVGKGTGLSLSISKGIALAHQGDIYLDDNTDCTTFALKIPAAPLAGVAHA